MTDRPHTLVIGYGNPGRADDGLGPALADAVERADIPGVRAIAAFQLQVEHAAEIALVPRVVFADACTGDGPPCALRRLHPRAAQSFSTHSVRPEAVLALARDVFGWVGDAYLLAIRGEAFDAFEESLSPAGAAALGQAAGLLLPALRRADIDSAVTLGPTDDSGTPLTGSTRCGTAST